MQMSSWRKDKKLESKDSVIKDLRMELMEKNDEISRREDQIRELREILGSHFDEKEIEELLQKDWCYDTVEMVNRMQWDLVLNYYLLQNIPIKRIGSTLQSSFGIILQPVLSENKQCELQNLIWSQSKIERIV